jgi:hypothetical protein
MLIDASVFPEAFEADDVDPAFERDDFAPVYESLANRLRDLAIEALAGGRAEKMTTAPGMPEAGAIDISEGDATLRAYGVDFARGQFLLSVRAPGGETAWYRVPTALEAAASI